MKDPRRPQARLATICDVDVSPGVDAGEQAVGRPTREARVGRLRGPGLPATHRDARPRHGEKSEKEVPAGFMAEVGLSLVEDGLSMIIVNLGIVKIAYAYVGP